jgi:RNA polymerase sigma-70 factor (ECF subfamily)
MECNDQDWIETYRRGDPEALAELVEKYRRPLFGFILNMTGGQNDADEIFQETWFRAIAKLDRYRHDNFMGWLVRIARNLIIDRHRRRRPTVSLDAPHEEGPGARLEWTDPAPGPRDRAVTVDALGAVAHAVAGLPEEQKEVFLMRMEAGMSFREIAGVQRVSINTALARMQYALAKLRPLLHSEYDAMRERS